MNVSLNFVSLKFKNTREINAIDQLHVTVAHARSSEFDDVQSPQD